MSEKNLAEQLKQDAAGKQIAMTPRLARRKLLKSTVAIPVIMTLHSGAALARSSNLAGAEINLENAAGDDNDVFCAITEGTVPEGANDLGDSPSYTRISRQTDAGINKTDDEIIQECTDGGGIIISAGAYNSIGGRTGWEAL